jgi:hypothetical protein
VLERNRAVWPGPADCQEQVHAGEIRLVLAAASLQVVSKAADSGEVGRAKAALDALVEMKRRMGMLSNH